MKKLLTLFAVFCFGFSAMAQTEIADGKSLIEAYISPLGNSLGAALNNGWYNTAKPHQRHNRPQFRIGCFEHDSEGAGRDDLGWG